MRNSTKMLLTKLGILAGAAIGWTVISRKWRDTSDEGDLNDEIERGECDEEVCLSTENTDEEA